MQFWRSLSWYTILLILLFIGGAIFFLYKILFPTPPVWITANVERGDVTEFVSVSGFVEAKQIADLAFPASGIVTAVLVEAGSQVKAGDLIATLAATNLVAERNAAYGNLTAKRSAYSQLISGPRDEAVLVSDTTLDNALANFKQTEKEEAQKIQNARAALLSTNLTATAIDPNTESTAPTVSGTYTCDTEGSYIIEIYGSAADSGYSYNVSGLETSTESVTTAQPGPLGDCGLYLQFTAGDNYRNSEWLIELPNSRGANYVTLKNNLDLVLTQAANNIAAARNNLTLAEKERDLTLAPALTDEIEQAQAAVQEAEASVAASEAKLADRSIVAPFSGIVTEVNVTLGEVANLNPVVTLLADNAYTLKARVPEIDITKLAVGQKITAVFDAESSETVAGTITYVSPIAKQLDGVAYFEINIVIDEVPDWLRAGLNADIDIIVSKKENVLRIPKRFVSTLTDGSKAVLVANGRDLATTTVEVLFTGNDSFLEVKGLAEGTVVVAP